MFPSLPHRLLVAASILLGAWVLASAAPVLISADGASAPTLMMARNGLIAALFIVLVAALPIIVLSLIGSSVGNPLTGLFALTTALWILSAQGDTIDGWIRRTSANLPGDYLKLAVESIIWLALLTAFLLLITIARPSIRRWLPLLVSEHQLGEPITLRSKWLPALVSGLVTAIVGGLLASFLLRTPEKGQVIGGLILAFLIGGLVGDMASAFLFQKHPANPMGILIAPTLVAITGYLLTSMNYDDGADFLKAYFNTRAAGLALALPLDYASAGVAGAALGAGWSQVMLHGEPSQPAAAKTENATSPRL